MTKALRALFFLMILFSTATAFADNVGTSWQPIIDRLLNSGVRTIGNFDIQAFRDAAGKIEAKSLNEAPASVLSGSRQSGYNRCGDKAVHVVDRLPTEVISSLGQLELHERLGVLCYDDRNTAISTALVLISEMNDSPGRRALLQKFAATVFARPIKFAGGTGISGGGDLITMFVKAAVLKLIMGDEQNRLAATNDFLVRFADIDFEPLQSNIPRYVYVQWSVTRNRKESLSVYIPMERWKQGDGARTALIHEAARKIMELFPSNDQHSSRTFRPSSCTGNQTANYPMTQDPAVRQIQDARAGFLLGCRKFFEGETGFSVLAPALPSEQEPKQSGYYHFTCSFQFGHGQPIISHATVMAGRGQTSTVPPNATPSGAFMMADLMVKPDGSIYGTRVIVHESGKPLTAKDIPPVTLAANATHSVTQTVIEGQSATFSCQRDK